MPNSSAPKYCYLDPDFPDTAFAAVILLRSEELGLSILPFDFIYVDIEDIKKSVHLVFEEISKQSNEMIIEDNILVFPITLQKRYPLKRAFWSTNVPKYSISHKVKAFIPLIDRPFLYKLLVTPAFYETKHKRWYLNATYPFSIFAEDTEIEEFMFNSDQPVYQKAKNAALYTLELPKRLNWKTGEIVEIESDFNKMPKIVS